MSVDRNPELVNRGKELERPIPPAFRWGLLGVFVVAAAIYANTTRNGFVQDDHYLITQNDDVKALSNWTSLFAEDFFASDEAADEGDAIGYYRPVTRLSWMVDYALWGDDASGFHRTSVLTHAMATLLLTLLLARIVGRGAPALLGGLLFAVHPVHTESVNIITARSDVLGGLFVVATLLFYLRSRSAVRGAPTARALALFCFALGLLSKEVGAAALPALMALELIDTRGGWMTAKSLRGRATALVPFVLVLLGYLMLRRHIIGGSYGNELAEHGLWAWIYGVPVAAIHHLRTLFWPVDLRFAYPVYLSAEVDGAWLLSVAAMAVLAGAAVIAWRRDHPAFVLGLAVCAAGLAPALVITQIHIPGAVDTLPLADRWLYTPSLGYGLVAAWFLAIAPAGSARIATVGGLTLALVFAALTWSRGPVFESDLTMMAETTQDFIEDADDLFGESSSRAFHAVTTIGLQALERGDLDGAEPYLRRAVEIGNGSARAINNLASLELARGNNEAVVELLTEALPRAGEREHEAVYMNLAVALTRLDRTPEAVVAYERALGVNSDNADASLGLGSGLMRLGQRERAIEVLRAGFERHRDDHRLAFNLGSACSADCPCATPAMIAYLAESQDPGDHPRRRMANRVLSECGVEP